MLDNIFYNWYTSSSYSLLESSLSINQIVKFSIDNQLEYAILCDNNLSGAIEFYHTCKNQKIKPIIGLDWKNQNHHYLLFAINNNGYHNLLKIESFTKLNKEFNINDYVQDLIIVNCNQDDHLINNNQEVYNINELAINHACCLTKDDLIDLDILYCISNEILLENIETSFTKGHNYLLRYEQALNYYSKDQILKTNSLIQKCDWVLDDYKIKLAKFPLPKDFKDSRSYLEHCCLLGLKQKVCKDNGSYVDKKYIERLNHELDVINSMGYDDYFLIVSDFVNWAKHHEILIGPGRGSAAGSLVAFLTNITDIDPIKHNLIFERFLNVDRKTLPDIDIDVMDTRRQELIDYIFDKYHPENTSYICAYQKIKAKMAIRDVGRILNINLKIVDKISKLISSENEDSLSVANNDLKLYYDTYTNLFEYAKKIINIPRQISTHAAGIIIADDKLWNYLPLTIGIDGWQLSEYSMEYLESLGLFKIDILGLKNLSIIDEVIKLIYETKHEKIDLNKINLNDTKLFDDISKGNTIGIFQLESPGMKNTIMKIMPKSIEDISICSALFRPGPQAMIPDFVKTRNGVLEPKYLNDDIKPILEPTLGFCIYQEQVIELIKAVTNFSTSQADIFRRAISKKKEELFLQMRKDFIEAAIKNNFNEQEANKIYDFILEFANYGFNHSHSLAYSYISYQMMYLKYYYPLEFYTTLLKYGDSIKNNLYISEAKKRNINIYNVDIRYSMSNFSIFNNGIMFGFSNIKGFGQETTKKILEIRNKYAFDDWMEIIGILTRNGISKKNIEILVKTGAFDNFNVDRNYILKNLDEIIDKGSIAINNTHVFDINLDDDFQPMNDEEKQQYEYDYLSYTFSNNQYDKVFNEYQSTYNLCLIDDQINLDKNYLIQIKQLKYTMTKYNKKMCFIEFSANNIDYNCVSFSENIFNNLEVNKYYVVKLKLGSQNKMQLASIVDKIQ